MASESVKGSNKITSGNSVLNAFWTLIKETISKRVNTASVVQISAAVPQGIVGPSPRVTALPLVMQSDGRGNSIPSTPIADLPVFRPQAGVAAIIMDPQPGDIGLAICAKRDSSNVGEGTLIPAPAGSFRQFNEKDSFILNGFHGGTPLLYLKLDPVTHAIELSTDVSKIEISVREAGNIDINTLAGDIDVTTSGGTVNVTSPAEVNITAPRTNVLGNLWVAGNIGLTGEILGDEFIGAVPIRMRGGLRNVAGFIWSNGVVVETHQHGGVDSGPSFTFPPTIVPEPGGDNA